MRHVFVIIDGASPLPRIAIVIIGCRRGLRLATTHCHHWGYMGVATHVGGAPRLCVIVGGAWERGSHYPATTSVMVHSVTHWWRGHSTTPLLWLGSHVSCNSHWRSASWRWHRHGHHRGRSHCRHGLGHTQLTAWVGSPSDSVMAGITRRAPLSNGGQRGCHCQGHAWPT